jgi:hypothetical protein
MPAGRPTLLTPEIIKAASDYIEELFSYANPLLLSIEGLAIRLSVHRDSLYEWEKTSKEFSDILERLRQCQAQKLIDKGLNNQYNAAIAKMLLSKHGYVEEHKTESKEEITHKYEELTDEELDRVIKARQNQVS